MTNILHHPNLFSTGLLPYPAAAPLFSTGVVASPVSYPFHGATFVEAPKFEHNPKDSLTEDLVSILNRAHPAFGYKYPDPDQKKEDGPTYLSGLKTTVTYGAEKIDYIYEATYNLGKGISAASFPIALEEPTVPFGYVPENASYKSESTPGKTYKATYGFSYKKTKK